MASDSQPPQGQPSESPAAAWTPCTWTSRDGLELFYRDYPGSSERPPLLCLHGLTRNSRDFEAFAERYAGRYCDGESTFVVTVRDGRLLVREEAPAADSPFPASDTPVACAGPDAFLLPLPSLGVVEVLSFVDEGGDGDRPTHLFVSGHALPRATDVAAGAPREQR